MKKERGRKKEEGGGKCWNGKGVRKGEGRKMRGKGLEGG